MTTTPATNSEGMESSNSDEKKVRVVSIKLLHLILIMLAFLVSGASLMEVRMTKLEASVCRIVSSEIASHNADAISHSAIFAAHNLNVDAHPSIREDLDSVAVKLDRIVQNGVDSKVAMAELRAELRIISNKLDK